MAAFYARYVPPSKPAEGLNIYGQHPSKRKHEGDHQQLEASPKRSKTETTGKANRITRKQPQSAFQEPHTGDVGTSPEHGESYNIRLKQSPSGKTSSDGKEVLAKYSSTKVAEKSDLTHKSIGEIRSGEAGALELNSHTAKTPAVDQEKRKRKKKEKEGVRDGTTDTGNGVHSAVDADDSQAVKDLGGRMHAGIRQKFEKSKAKTRQTASSGEVDDDKTQGHGDSDDATVEGLAAVELHGLEPLPQPPQAEPTTQLPTYSALPDWMATPLQVPSSSTADFDDLNLDQHLVSNLRSKGLEKAFAVQAAVLPLLSEGQSRHRGDICISAATGSGKTLAYVLPLIQALKGLVGTKLRGLIVVPTRELVAQARDVCEVCAAGTRLRIATALGSKALRDEQSLLVEQHMVYDPEQYRKERQSPIDWTRFGLEDVVAQADDDTPPHYVSKFSSKVDILITTPGRLVDHLRSTVGFSLDDVQWVVIDEADRLLNESFQEWIEVVMPAFKSDAATRSRDELLRALRLEVPERHVQKVILSATMTQDISKLNSLDLRNPKLVVVGDLPPGQPAHTDGVDVNDTEAVPDANGAFHLPPTLAEFAVSVGDGSDKPLYLLELLQSHILRPPEQRNGLVASSVASTSSKTGVVFPSGTALEPDNTSSSGASDPSDSDTSSSVSDPSSSKSSHPLPSTQLAPTVLIFTRSTESANRLSRLLSLLAPSLAARLGTLTKSTHSASSRTTLSQFRQGKIGLLVATDRASRGLDLAGLAHVVSYDIPTSVTAYVHRVGRTARAGNEGQAWTLVGHREARWFWNEIGKAKEGVAGGEVRISRADRKVTRLNLERGGEGNREAWRQRYEDGLRVLGEEVRQRA